MKRIISTEMIAIERVLKSKFPDDRFIPVFFPKVCILGGAYEWAKGERSETELLKIHFSVVLIDIKTKLAICAVDWSGDLQDKEAARLKGAVCKALGVPYYNIHRAYALEKKNIAIDPRREISSTVTGRLNDWQFIAAAAFSIAQRGENPGLQVLSEIAIASLFSEERITDITELVKSMVPASPNYVEQCIAQMDVDALMVLDRPYSVPVFGFEYDGMKHRTDPPTREKDQIKNALFEAAGIPLIRIARDEHADGLMDDPRGRSDLGQALRTVSLELVKRTVLSPQFLERLSRTLEEEASDTDSHELATSYRGLARILKMVGNGLFITNEEEFEHGQHDDLRQEECLFWASMLPWFDCRSREFAISLGDNVKFREDYKVLLGPKAEGIRVSAPDVEISKEAYKTSSRAAYVLKIESDRNETIESARFERLRLQLAAGDSVGLSQEWLDKVILSAKRNCVLDKLVTWVEKRSG